MKIAILCRAHSLMALNTIDYFRGNNRDISLVVIETGERRKFSERERVFRQTHARFRKYLYPLNSSWSPRNVINFLWHMVPESIRTALHRVRSRLKNDPLKSAGIPFAEVERHSSEETRRLFEEHDISYALLISSAWLIKDPLLSMKKTRIINAHCAKLPQHRSLDALPWSVMANDPVGLTAYFVDEGIDSGPVLLFLETKKHKGDNLITLRKRVDSRKPEILLKALQGLENGSIKPVEQNASEGTDHRPMTLDELIEAEATLQKQIRDSESPANS